MTTVAFFAAGRGCQVEIHVANIDRVDMLDFIASRDLPLCAERATAALLRALPDSIDAIVYGDPFDSPQDWTDDRSDGERDTMIAWDVLAGAEIDLRDEREISNEAGREPGDKI